jgi:hypothetical protein
VYLDRTNEISFEKNLAEEECADGIPESIYDLKTFIPNVKDLLYARGLMAIPAGRRNAKNVLSMINATKRYFDIILFSFDSYDWSAHHMDNNVKFFRTPGGRKWKLAQMLLNTTILNESYSHVCMWDDDLLPTEYFDAGILLLLLQKFQMSVAQPSIRLHCHEYYEGTCVVNPIQKNHFQTVSLVEIQAPCYSRLVWLNYILPNILKNEDGSGWGIDKSLHFNPITPRVFVIQLPLDHLDSRELGGKENTTFQIQSYSDIASSLNWKKFVPDSKSFISQEFKVNISKSCDLVAISPEYTSV